MENITIGQIAVALVFLLGLWASVESIVKKVSKVFDSSLDKKLKPINEKMDKLDGKIDKVDSQATKNFLVSRLDAIERGEAVSEITKQRIYEEFEHYTYDLKGNSYIKKKFEKLQKDGQL